MGKSYYERRIKKIPDEILLEDFRETIKIKEQIKGDIAKLLVLHISWDDATFTAEIKKELSSLQEEINKQLYFYSFDHAQLTYECMKHELQRRGYELIGALEWTQMVIHMRDASGKEFEVAPWFAKDALGPDTLLRKLDLSERSINGLKRYSITTLGQLLDWREYHNVKNFQDMEWLWKKSYSEVESYLEEYKFIPMQ